MSGNNMSKPINNNEEYDSIYDFEEEEIYEDVYEYENEYKIRELIFYLENARNLAIDMITYPHQFKKTQEDNEPMHVYIKSEKLSFIRNKQHVHFDGFGQPY